MNIINKRNSYGVKWSADQYRNIKGVFFECYAFGSDDNFKKLKQEAKEEKLKYRVIDGQFYREFKSVKN